MIFCNDDPIVPSIRIESATMTQQILSPRLGKAQAQALWQDILHELVALKLTSIDKRAVFLRLGLLMGSLAAALALAWLTPSLTVALATSGGLAVVMAQWAFFAHDAGHGSLLPKKSHNRVLGQLAMTVVAGLAFDEWYGRHKTHHQFCQNEAKDPDMDVSLVASLTAASLKTKNNVGRMLTRWQGVHIWILSLLFGHSQRHLSQVGAIVRPRRYGLDLCCLGLHIGLWFLLPLMMLHIPLERVILVYLVPATLLGPYLAGIFWVNHVGMSLVDGSESLSFLEHQALTSRTIIARRSLDWIFGGLNYQIEHHLYPHIPSYRLRKCQPIVEKHLTRCSIPYHRYTYRQALVEIGRHFREISRLAA